MDNGDKSDTQTYEITFHQLCRPTLVVEAENPQQARATAQAMVEEFDDVEGRLNLLGTHGPPIIYSTEEWEGS